MPLNMQKVHGAYRWLPFGVKHSVRRAIDSLQPHFSYSWWVRHCEVRPDADEIAKGIARFGFKPKVSIVMPVYNTVLEHLDLAIGSVVRQHYQNWELCVCDDASPKSEVRERLEYWRKNDARIKVTYSAENEGISGASNRALELATGEFVGLMDHDDEITRDALFEVVKFLQDGRQADIIYSDEDNLDPQGRRVHPLFKPDWSPECILSYMYISHFAVYRRGLVDEIGGFRPEFTGAQDYDLFLRASEKTSRVCHIPRILYHWRMAPTLLSVSADTKPYAFLAAKKAITEHLERKGIAGEAVDTGSVGLYRVRFHLDGSDKVSIVVLSLGDPQKARNCIASVKEKTTYRNYELIIEEAGSADGTANLSATINRGVAKASGEYVLLLHDDTEVISDDWITAMLGFCQRGETGAVGAKLLYRTGRIQHVGVVLGLMGLAGYPLRGLYGNTLCSPEPSGFARNCSAVAGACMMVRREVFAKLGGFDEQLPSAYNDVDFCLRLREAGYRIVWTPDAELYHDEAESRNSAIGREADIFKRRWGSAIENDPYYNPNLTLKYADMGYRI